MRKLTPILLASTLVFSACTGADVTGVDDPINEGASISESMIDDSSSSDAMESSSSDAASSAAQSSEPASTQTRVIEMSVDNWTFAPAAISATTGEKVVLRVRGVAGRHSFAIPDLNINVPIEPGEVKDIELPTGTAGTFAFRCFIPCGDGHKEMTGTFTVS